MSRHWRAFWAVLLSILTLTGCTPSRTFYFHEDGELSYYKGMATNIEFPDVESATLADVTHTLPPPTLRNIEDYQFWDLCLQDAIQTTLTNSKVVRLLRGGSAVGTIPDGLLAAPEQSPTVYDPAIQQANPGIGGRQGGGVESALSAFDAQLAASMLWSRNEQPRNVPVNLAEHLRSRLHPGHGHVSSGVGQADGLRNAVRREPGRRCTTPTTVPRGKSTATTTFNTRSRPGSRFCKGPGRCSTASPDLAAGRATSTAS